MSLPSRRTFLGGAAFATAAAAAATEAGRDRLTLGFLYNGPKNDLGYNQSHAEGKQTLRRYPWVNALDEASVPETVAAEESMQNMIHQDSASAVFATSYGFYDPFVLHLARNNPRVQFFHCGGSWMPGKHPENIGIYFGFIDEVEYLSGMVAGLTTRTNKLGFVAAKPIPQVLRNINCFTMGARSVNPKVTTQVVFTGDWVLPVREAEASSSLADQGVDVLTGHTGSPRVIVQVAERRGIFGCGYQFNQSSMAPRGFLTGAEWHWGTVYRQYAEMLRAGKSVIGGSIPRRLTGTLKDEFCQLSPFGPRVAEPTRQWIAAAKAKIIAGTLAIYGGPIRDNAGKTQIAAGAALHVTDPELDKMDWLVEGVIGKTRG